MRRAGLDRMLAVVPFVLILLGIAILPLAIPRRWESNKFKALFVAVISLPTAAYILKTDSHLLVHAASEYASFIVLLGSLFIVAGGIALRGELVGSTTVNVILLFAGAVLANLIGTTGASMLLIRPILRANENREYTRHVPIFFIFIVSNAGGLLTPLGDPPLFIGFLRGVPFTWTLKLFPVWIFVVGTLLVVFAALDRVKNRGIAPVAPRTREPLSISGWHHFAYLIAIVGSAAFFPAGLRESVMIVAAAVAYKKSLSLHPIIEVAILFIGIFITIQPALVLLRDLGPSIGLSTPREFFFVTGSLSSVLDNAPTYLAFFTLAQSIGAAGGELVGTTGVPAPYLVAISLGAVLFGANTYVGNGPNFMVKAICDEAGFKTPSFFGYIGWSACVLGPVWAAIALIFL